MRVLGITTEYDPIHNGHIYHLEQSKKITNADYVVAVMSGDFTQRGMPAILSKWDRAEMAAKSGVDLVIELPFTYATASAERFCSGAIETLASLGCVTDICFGSESGELENLQKIATLLGEEPKDFKIAVRKHLDNGRSYPKARELAIVELLGLDYDKEVTLPNNILAIEYLKALKDHPEITPHTVERIAVGHNEIDPADNVRNGTTYFSASAIREHLLDAEEEHNSIAATQMFILDAMPKPASEILCKKLDNITDPEKIWPYIRMKLLQADANELKNYSGVVEGLENRMLTFVRAEDSMEDFIDQVRSARFTNTAVRRMLLHALVGMTKKDEKIKPSFNRVLAANEKGRELLRYIQKNETSKKPVLTNINRQGFDTDRCAELDRTASDIYNQVYGNDLYLNSDQVMTPYIEGAEEE